MWRRIDFFLLDRLYQPIFDAVSEQVGDPIAMCRKLLIAFVVLTCCYIGWRFYYDLLDHSLPLGLIVAFATSQALLVVGAMFMFWLFSHVKYPVGRVNPLRYVIAVPRFLLLVIYTILLTVTLTDGWISVSIDTLRNLAVISALYFASCQNRPPLRQSYPEPQLAPALT
jgi:hypothetical protein